MDGEDEHGTDDQSASSHVSVTPVEEERTHSGIQQCYSTQTSIQSAETSIQSAETSIQSAETSIQSAETSIQSTETSIQSAETFDAAGVPSRQTSHESEVR